MDSTSSDQSQIDDAVVKSYFDGADGTTAAAISMMAHGHNLPSNAIAHRLAKEQKTISKWLDAVQPSKKCLMLVVAPERGLRFLLVVTIVSLGSSAAS